MDYYGGSRAPGKGLGDRVRRFGFDLMEALLHTQCDVLITLNRYAKARLQTWGVPSRRIVVAGLWKPDEYFVGDREAYRCVLLEKGVLTPDQYERLRGRIVISFLGLFYRHTHVRELLDAAKDYPDDIAVILAGKGHDLPLVEARCARHANLVFLGWRNDEELRELGRVTDIMYQPLNPAENINWKYFGSTNKVFEALAAGCLFIGSAINERVDLNAEAEFAVQIDFGKDLGTQLHELFRSILADREVLASRQRNARRLFRRYNHAAFVNLVRPWFVAPPRA
jgi:glycosyltransferase involved in cell wall biosynthesis